MRKYVVATMFMFAVSLVGGEAMAKYADLAGSWYPASPSQLRAEIGKYIADAKIGNIGGHIVAVIAPHAGTRFSGPVAGYAYKAIAAQAPAKIIILGFSHRQYIPKTAAVFTGDKFVTPLGETAVDADLTSKLMSCDRRIKDLPAVFDGENSVELQIPFAQEAVKNAKLVLIAMTDQDRENCLAVAQALYETLKGEDDFIIVASSDMSHYLPYETANAKDGRTVKTVSSFDPDLFYEESLLQRNEIMCGYGAVYTAMVAARKLGADRAELLKYANSGDTSGMKDRVVGYMSVAFVRSGGSPMPGEALPAARTVRAEDTSLPSKKEGEQMFNAAQRKELLKIARETIKLYLETGKRYEPQVSDEALKQNMGAFVTLHKNGELRGCIGHMAATGPLYITVRDMAIAAATEDPRFAPMTASELKNVDIEISALSPMRKVSGPGEVKIPGNGVMVRMGWRSGVYLPQVADETGWNKEEFMNSLCAHKAGIPMDAWKTGACEIFVFTAEVFGEKELGVK